MSFRVFFLFCSVLVATQVAFGQAVPVNDENQKGYLVGPGDELTGKILGESQFDFVSTVDENGNIEIPFFDKPIYVKCLSERDLRTEVTKLLSKYLKYPQVSIRVTQRNSRPPVSIYGEVREQQRVNLTRRAHLLELISFAGGVSEKSGGMVQVFRPHAPICADPKTADDWKVAGTDPLNVPSRVYSLAGLRQGREDSNPEIFPGDIIMVQKSAPVYVTGEVMKPGEMGIPEGGLPLTQAIAMASGITREAKTKTVKIYRRKEGSPNPEVLSVNYDLIKKGTQKDVLLQAFDIVEVDKTKKSIGDILLEAVIGIPNRLPIPIRPF